MAKCLISRLAIYAERDWEGAIGVEVDCFEVVREFAEFEAEFDDSGGEG